MVRRSPAPLSIAQAAREAPNRVAITWQGSPLTFTEVARRVAERARALQDARGSGRPCAIVTRHDLETVIEMLACMEIARPFVPLPHRMPEEERRRRARDFASPTFTDTRDDERPLAVVPTTGTSGAPKGAVLSRRAFLASAEANARHLGWNANDAWLLSLPLHHVGGLSIVVRCLVARARLVIAERHFLEPFDGTRFASLLRRDGVTLASLVPTQLHRWTEALERNEERVPLRAVLLGGSAATPALRERAARLGLPVLPTYGLTETCSQIATGRPREAGADRVGPPLHGVELRIRDGRILVRGPMLFSGYRSEAGETTSPFLPGGWFDTGDLGHVDESGILHVEGRASDRIITGGENVDPLTVEAALAECELVAESVVYGVPDERWGERVAAVVVPRPPSSPGAMPPGELEVARAIDEVARRLLAPWERPRIYAVRSELPRHANGKIDRRRAVRETCRHLREMP